MDTPKLITDHLGEAMSEMRLSMESLDKEGMELEHELMARAHTAAALSHSLIHMINMRRLAALLSDGDSNG